MRTLGRFRLHALEAGLQRLDGGAMFGVVPKPLWEKRIAPDERNRIPLALRCLLVETPDALVLIDNGVGNKEDTKFHDIYGIENAGAVRRVSKTQSALPVSRPTTSTIDDRHAPALRSRRRQHLSRRACWIWRVRLSFPDARYLSRRASSSGRTRKNERMRRAICRTTSIPCTRAGRLELVEGERQIIPGIECAC